ncbi:MAG: saccharopine dehydrogenase NADP-binding domain-containing protein [Clostridiales Family XIII bacterium]|jgi:saccharopine dehydrogenase (NAD+, L-lysine-forming)|nr:saccharopine dehydrogenase NADP-binding domain-containing protein [Clostridiales Family XIII bacterium]
MKIFIVGAGGQGGPCASVLARDPAVSRIVLGDLDPSAAARVREKIGSPKIQTEQVDARSERSLAKAAEGADVVIDLVLPEFGEHVMRAALEAGAHYVNTAFYQPFFDQFYKGEPLFLDQEFRDAGLTAVLGCGMAPGFLNVVTRLYADKLDRVESIRLRLAKKKLGAEEMVTPYNPGWSPKQALLDCAEDVYVLEDGKLRILGAYSGLERYAFPEPLGEMLVSHHAHEEPLSMPRFIGKGLRYCDFKYYVAPQPAAFIHAGLASEEPVEVNGALVKPLDLLVKLLPKSGNAFLEEDASKYEELDRLSHVCMMIEMEGEKDGVKRHYRVHLPKMTANGAKLRELFGTALINVALPAVIGAKMAVAGCQKGVISSECLDPHDFLDRFLGTGIPYKWKEL